METVLLVVHLIIAVALVGLILLQRSEGGALGVGGSANMGAVAPRAQADALTKTTGWLAGAFIATSLLLVVLAHGKAAPVSLADKLATESSAAGETSPAAAEQQSPVVPVEPTTPAVPLAQ